MRIVGIHERTSRLFWAILAVANLARCLAAEEHAAPGIRFAIEADAPRDAEDPQYESGAADRLDERLARAFEIDANADANAYGDTDADGDTDGDTAANGNAPANSNGSSEPAEEDRCATDVWLVSTRRMPRCESKDDSIGFAPDLWRRDGSGEWQRATLDELTDGPSAVHPTTILVHGNQFSLDDAIQQGKQMERELAGRAGARRLVVWTWPSDRIRGSILKDVKIKAGMADAEGRRLGRFLLQFKPPAPITLVGFSYGAKVILGGLHAHAGGDGNVSGPLEGTGGPSPPLRAVLLAAAVDRTWLEPGARLERALDRVECLTVFVNPHDRVLQWFQRLPGGSGGQALGYAGLCGVQRGEHFDKVVEVNVNSFVGRRHAWEHYIRSRPAMSRLRRELDGVVAGAAGKSTRGK